MLGVSHLPAPENADHLNLVALLQELAAIGKAIGEVVIGNGGPHPHLLQPGGSLLTTSAFAILLALLILELAEVHDLADGRSCVGRDFDKVEARILGEALRLIGGHNSVLFTLLVNQTYFGDADAMIQTVVLSGHSAPCVMGSGIVLG